jgi:hypothetical protein
VTEPGPERESSAGADNRQQEQMLRRIVILLAFVLVLPTRALAGGGNYEFEGATPTERSTVRAALNASSFDWGVVAQRVTIHVGPFGVSRSTPEHIWLDRGLVASGRFAWGTVMDEYAHQVDFLVLDAHRREILQQRLQASAWCYEREDVPHNANGCERFASMVAWAYWPSRHNSYSPHCRSDESAAMPAGEFRRLLATMVGVPAFARALG